MYHSAARCEGDGCGGDAAAPAVQLLISKFYYVTASSPLVGMRPGLGSCSCCCCCIAETHPMLGRGRRRMRPAGSRVIFFGDENDDAMDHGATGEGGHHGADRSPAFGRQQQQQHGFPRWNRLHGRVIVALFLLLLLNVEFPTFIPPRSFAHAAAQSTGKYSFSRVFSSYSSRACPLERVYGSGDAARKTTPSTRSD